MCSGASYCVGRFRKYGWMRDIGDGTCSERYRVMVLGLD